MKRSKRLSLLLGVLVVVCVATFAVMQLEEKKEQIKLSGEVVLEVSSADVQSLSWEYGDTALAFHKEDVWLYDGDEAFPVDEDAILELLEQFEAFSVSFIIEDVTDYSMYGLDDPLCTIQLATQVQTYEITLGDFSTMDEERYVSIGDGNVYLAKTDPLNTFDAGLKDFIKHDENLSYQQVTQIQFAGAEAYSIFYEEDSAAASFAEDVYFTQQNGQTLPLDTDRVGTYLEGLTTLNLSSYVTYNVTEEELETYGLDNPELIITVDYTTLDENGNEIADTFVLSVSRDPEQLAAAEESEEEDIGDIAGYVRVGDSQIIYEISASACTKLLAASYNQLRHREVLAADFEDVYQIDISLDGSSYTLSIDSETDDEEVWTYLDSEVDIDSLQSALESLRADSFAVDGSAGKEEIALTVYLNQEDRPQTEIKLYRLDGSSCIAQVDGETFALISRSDVVELIEAVNAIVLS